MGHDINIIREPQVNYDSIIKLAERVGVKPVTEDDPIPFLTITTDTGDRYDPFAIFNGLLDYLNRPFKTTHIPTGLE